MKKVLTLCIIEREGEVLLGMKKRGFGQGRWNGFGGKLQEGESIEEGARRETKEEAGIEIVLMEERGVLEFEFQGSPEILEVHVFAVLEFTGEPEETEEMKPQWFLQEDIPFDQMWPDDRHWLPLFLAGKRFRGTFLFQDMDTILDMNMKETKSDLGL